MFENMKYAVVVVVVVVDFTDIHITTARKVMYVTHIHTTVDNHVYVNVHIKFQDGDGIESVHIFTQNKRFNRLIKQNLHATRLSLSRYLAMHLSISIFFFCFFFFFAFVFR